MTVTEDDDALADAVEAAGLSHLLPEYEQSLRAAMHQAKRLGTELDRVLDASQEPALTFVPITRKPPA